MVTHSSIHCSKTPSVCWTYSPEASESKLLVAIFHLGEGQSTKRNLLSEKTLLRCLQKHSAQENRFEWSAILWDRMYMYMYLSIYIFLFYVHVYVMHIYIVPYLHIYTLYIIYSYCECPRIHRPLRQVARKG